MAFLTVELRNQLERIIIKAREAAEVGATSALQALAVHHRETYTTMTAEQRELRNRLRAHGRQLGDTLDTKKGTQEIFCLMRECAYEHWHRMLFARFLAENNLLIEPKSGVSVTLAECEELARERGEDPWAMASSFAQRMLPQIFRVGDPTLEVILPPETRQTLKRLLEELPAIVFTADDALGWTYQFWQSAEKKRVNDGVDSGEKVSGRSLPAVTQLFTEDYMVLFLLHNSLGAWYAGKVLAEKPEMSESAVDEEVLRAAMVLPGYTFDYLRFIRDGEDGGWRPAAGSYDAWPRQAKELKVLDPCCGSGHFLAASFDLLVRLRMAEEGLSLVDAIEAVLVDNLFGLELDARCTQIAAFNLALTAWKMVGRVTALPALNIACSGLSVGVPKRDWLKLAGDDQKLRAGMDQLYSLFEQAPELGSLIDPRRALGSGNLITADFHDVQPLLAQVLERGDLALNDEQLEVGVAAQGIAKAAELLAGRYNLVITNVPYLKYAKQDITLKKFCDKHFEDSKLDLATVFLERCLQLCKPVGSISIVLPQNWLFLLRYSNLREKLLKNNIWHIVAWLGAGAFETITGEVVKPILTSISWGFNSLHFSENTISAIDVSESKRPAEKDQSLHIGSLNQIEQQKQLANPDARVYISAEPATSKNLLGKNAISKRGIVNGDVDKWIRYFWEIIDNTWEKVQMATNLTINYSGRSCVIDWASGGCGMLRPGLKNETYTKTGVAISRMGDMPATLYTGEFYDQNTAVVILDSHELLAAFWCFSKSNLLMKETRILDKKLGVTPATLLKIPFDTEYWKDIAETQFPNGLPKPYSDDPTQWIFHGHPCGSVIWDEQSKRTAYGSLRTDATVLHVAMARLLGYRWPAELDTDMGLAQEMREWVRKCDDLLCHADNDGVVSLSSLRGEEPAGERLRALLAAAYGREWSPMVERRLLQAAGGDKPAASLEEWLQDRFFGEHCKLFGHRPFIWHIWDGRKDGFSVLVNYHQLAGAAGRRMLENITYTLLGDWIGRQRAEQREERDGAEGRLIAALALQEQMIKIIEGEPPYDIFVRWKPLHQQPIGWEPDINDGVRINIRPFLSAVLRVGGKAGVLRFRPSINWKKDRGAELKSIRPKEKYPWFWQCNPEGNVVDSTDLMGGKDFDGNRWNDLHYSNAVKRAARVRAEEETL